VAAFRKQWEIGPRFLLITNRNWHAPFQIRWKASTFDDLEGQWQPVRPAVLATAGLLVTTYVWLSDKVQFAKMRLVICQIFLQHCNRLLIRRCYINDALLHYQTFYSSLFLHFISLPVRRAVYSPSEIGRH